MSSFYCVRAKSLQSCLTLCDSMDCSPPGSSVHGILQARTLEWVAVPSSWGSSPPRDGTLVSYVPALAGGFFTTSATWEAPVLLQRRSNTHKKIFLQGFPGGSVVKNPPANAGDTGSIPDLGRPHMPWSY